MPEFAKPYLGGGEPVIHRALEPALAYQCGVTLAWRDARSFLAEVFEGLERGLGRLL